MPLRESGASARGRFDRTVVAWVLLVQVQSGDLWSWGLVVLAVVAVVLAWLSARAGRDGRAFAGFATFLGLGAASIFLAEERGAFGKLLTDAGLPAPKYGTAFSFEVIESHDADYLGDTPAHLGRNGGLTVRPHVALGDAVVDHFDLNDRDPVPVV